MAHLAHPVSSNGTYTLSDDTRAKIRELTTRYPSRRTALLPSLKLAQKEVGYLPPPIIAQVADLVGVPHSAAAELVAFYTMLHEEPAGTTRVTVCAQLPCALRGAEQLLRDLSAALAIQPGETTPDGAVTLERTSECFGACHRAPMARVDDHYWENLDEAGTQRLVTHLSLTPGSGRPSHVAPGTPGSPRSAERGGKPAETIHGPVQQGEDPDADHLSR
jgi:NADH-quinone oxidoreductase subunit E